VKEEWPPLYMTSSGSMCRMKERMLSGSGNSGAVLEMVEGMLPSSVHVVRLRQRVEEEWREALAVCHITEVSGWTCAPAASHGGCTLVVWCWLTRCRIDGRKVWGCVAQGTA
jgi:hypothetical protein